MIYNKIEELFLAIENSYEYKEYKIDINYSYLSIMQEVPNRDFVVMVENMSPILNLDL